MINDLKNREFTPERKPGRPPKSLPRQEEQEAIVDMTQRKVLPMVCRKCGRGMTPIVLRWNKDEAYCRCQASGCMFVYRPATVRML